MRLLLVIPNIVSFRSFLRELCAGLAADGTEVHLACSVQSIWSQKKTAFDGMQIHPIDFARGMNPLAHLRAARALDRLVTTLQPDLVHTHFSAAIFTTALARTARWPRTWATFHGLTFPGLRGWKRTLLWFTESWSAAKMDAVWVLSEDDRETLRVAAPRADVRRLPGFGVGCDLEKFAPVSASDRTARRAELGLAESALVFAFVGRFVEFKGFDLAVRAFFQLAARIPSARLLLIGARDPLHPTGLTAAEEAQLAGSAQVVPAGYRDDVEQCLPAADVLVFPSRREGMPVCAMEALALGVPVLTRDARGCREVVRDGVDGLVLRACGVGDLSRAMQRLADDPALREEFSAQARAGRARFDRAHFIAEQQAIYATLETSSAPRPATRGAVKVAHVTTVASSLHGLLLNQMLSLGDAGYDVCGISSPGAEVGALTAAGLAHFAVSIGRNLSPAKDLASLWALWRVMRREHFTIVHTHTPKAGLLGQLAARLSGVPIVVNTVHGFYFHEHMRPLARRFYIMIEKIAARCSDLILSQNDEDVETAVRERICPREKIRLLGNGIDLEQFAPERVTAADLARVRAECGWAQGTPVVGFVGRLAGKRKGFCDFLKAAQRISAANPAARFLIVGAADSGKPDAVEPSIAGDYGVAERCFFAGHRENVELPAFYALMSVLVLPSLFEGVPRVVMEAAAMGVPAIVSDVKGNREAVVDELTGLLVPLGDVPALSDAILRLLADLAHAADMGRAGRRLAHERFDERTVFARIQSAYAELLLTPSLPTLEPARI